MGAIYELINKHISKGLYKNNALQKKMETDYYPEAAGLLVYKQMNRKKKKRLKNFKQ